MSGSHANVKDFISGESFTGPFRNPSIACQVLSVATDDGASLHVRCYGPESAPSIVLIHGFGVRAEYWNPQINALAHRYRVIVYDQRLSGCSTVGKRPASPATFGDDLAEVLSATIPDGQTAVVAGHSFGGITVMAWAARHPEQVRRYAHSVLLANTVAERFDSYVAIVPFPGRYGRARRLLVESLATTRIPTPPVGMYRQVFRNNALSRNASREAVDFTAALFATCPPALRAEWGRALKGLDVSPGIANLRVPTTVLTCSLDRLTPPRASDTIVRTLTAGGYLDRHVALKDVGHCSNIERPASFNNELERLVQRDRPAPTADDRHS